MKYFFLIFLIVLVFCAPFFISPDFLILKDNDLGRTYYPLFYFFKSSIIDYHQFPLWRPTILGGMPFISDPLSSIFYPFNILFLILPINFAFIIYYLIHLTIAGIGTFQLARYFKMPCNFALFSAVVFMLAPKSLAHIGAGHLTLIAAVSLFPWAIYLSLQVFKNKWFVNAVLLAAVLTLIFFAHPTIFYYSLIAVFIFGVANSISIKQLFKSFRLLPVLALFFGFSAMALFPYWEFANFSTRRLLTIFDIAFPPWNFGKFLASLLFPYLNLNKWDHEAFLYFGFFPSVFAFFGFLKLSKKLKICIGFAGIVIILFALNTSTPFFEIVYKILPFASMLRVSTRPWFILILIVSLLTGFGLSKVIKKQFIVYLIILLTLAEFGYIGYQRIGIGGLLNKPNKNKEIYQIFENDRSTYRIYCTSFCLNQAEVEKRNLRLAIGEHPSALRNYTDFLSLAGGYEWNQHAVIYPPYQVWLDKSSPPQPDSDLLGELAVKYVLSKYPLTNTDFVKTAQFDDLIVYQNQKFKKFDYQITPNEMTVRFKGSAPSKLVMPEIYYPGWIALVDGKERQLQKADGIFMAVNLKENEKEVIFKFRPKIFTIGLVITMFTIVSVLLFVTRKNYR